MCDFPAEQLLKMWRQASQEADKLTNDPYGPLKLYADFVLTVETLGMIHEEMTGCQCWEKAVRDSGVP